jgi:hypothetical protein
MKTAWRAFLLIFLVHLGVQGLFLTRVPAQHVLPHTRWEVPAVAMALYERGEFADPYCLPTGPTAHMPPFQPALMAAIYHLLGPTLAAGYVLWLLGIAFYGVMYAMLPWLGSGSVSGPAPGSRAAGGGPHPALAGLHRGLAAVAIGLMAAQPSCGDGAQPGRRPAAPPAGPDDGPLVPRRRRSCPSPSGSSPSSSSGGMSLGGGAGPRSRLSA